MVVMTTIQDSYDVCYSCLHDAAVAVAVVNTAAVVSTAAVVNTVAVVVVIAGAAFSALPDALGTVIDILMRDSKLNSFLSSVAHPEDVAIGFLTIEHRPPY